MSYEQKLMQMKKLLKKKTDEKVEPEVKKEVVLPPAYEQQWLDAGLTKEKNKHGIVYKRIVEYSTDYQHGNIVLSGLKSTIDEWRKSGEDTPAVSGFFKAACLFRYGDDRVERCRNAHFPDGVYRTDG